MIPATSLTVNTSPLATVPAAKALATSSPTITRHAARARRTVWALEDTSTICGRPTPVAPRLDELCCRAEANGKPENLPTRSPHGGNADFNNKAAIPGPANE
eukprot:CAMPEP_0176132166 /NCGR_PEP_ID=MMETSP0120_2-20121206/66930_1 /TAXON_ID=160619 /ORGANISM="Kryptoperidinium foliaceum, Strain CCMP 1326" /LENGTH=101 /DNA_ID=CAMNT_0017467593 /DNA_START=447 /DNA_END=749 /DNA_ORIENTATION=-